MTTTATLMGTRRMAEAEAEAAMVAAVMVVEEEEAVVVAVVEVEVEGEGVAAAVAAAAAVVAPDVTEARMLSASTRRANSSRGPEAARPLLQRLVTMSMPI